MTKLNDNQLQEVSGGTGNSNIQLNNWYVEEHRGAVRPAPYATCKYYYYCIRQELNGDYIFQEYMVEYEYEQGYHYAKLGECKKDTTYLVPTSKPSIITEL